MTDRPKLESLVELNIIKAPAQDKNDAYVLTPMQLQAFAERKIVAVGIGWSYTVALDSEGNVYSFGSSDNGK
jgi:alpha-tubulin suppressor-like RCC1 family protein